MSELELNHGPEHNHYVGMLVYSGEFS